jgi:hypothetical protein
MARRPPATLPCRPPPHPPDSSSPSRSDRGTRLPPPLPDPIEVSVSDVTAEPCAAPLDTSAESDGSREVALPGELLPPSPGLGADGTMYWCCCSQIMAVSDAFVEPCAAPLDSAAEHCAPPVDASPASDGSGEVALPGELLPARPGLRR